MEIARDVANGVHTVYVGKGRQEGLTQLCPGIMTHFGLRYPGTVILYMTTNLENAKLFSKYRFKEQTMRASPKIAELFRAEDDLVLSRSLNNGSLLLYRSGQDHLSSARSVPNDLLILDECNELDMTALPIARESMAASPHNRLLCIGTGQTEGGSWERTFHTGEQYRYNSKTKKWSKVKGTIQNPDVHSYYLPQSDTGLFSKQEIHKKINSYLSKTIGLQEIECAWTSGSDKPFAEHTMQACLIDSTAAERNEHSKYYYLGIDFGGGRSKTCLILLSVDHNDNIMINDARIIETKNVDMQAREIIQYIETVKPAHTVCDIGGGTYQVQTLEAKYGSRLTKGHLMANLTNPFDFQRSERLLNLDKTAAVDNLIDKTQQQKLKIPKKFDWIIQHFTSIESKLAVMSGGQAYTRYFVDKSKSHDDAAMATVFAIAAHKIKGSGSARIVGVY